MTSPRPAALIDVERARIGYAKLQLRRTAPPKWDWARGVPEAIAAELRRYNADLDAINGESDVRQAIDSRRIK